MASTRGTGDLIDRCQASLDSAKAACARSIALVDRAGAARAHARQVALDAVNRRGRAIVCQVRASPLRTAADGDAVGAILLMTPPMPTPGG